jgi:hypothetical protein
MGRSVAGLFLAVFALGAAAAAGGAVGLAVSLPVIGSGFPIAVALVAVLVVTAGGAALGLAAVRAARWAYGEVAGMEEVP